MNGSSLVEDQPWSCLISPSPWEVRVTTSPQHVSHNFCYSLHLGIEYEASHKEPSCVLHMILIGIDSLMVQWLGICLLMQGTQVRSWSGRIPHATKPVHHSYWTHTPEPTSHNYWSPMPRQGKARGSSTTRETTTIKSPPTETREWPLLSTNRKSLRAATKT